jgi:BASS family bile acid:Na+ symporter
MFDTAVIPQSVTTGVAGAAIFVVMFSLGLAIDVRDLRWAWARPWLVARGLASVLILVPIAGVAVARAFGLALEAQVGVALMVISPGAPVALRRSLDAGGHYAFAPVLQVLVATLAIVSMPISVGVLNWFYGTHGSLSPALVARQVFMAQLLPLGLGLFTRSVAAPLALRVEPIARRVATIMLVAFGVLVLMTVWPIVLGAAPRTAVVAAIVSLLAVAIGHVLGAPDGETRTAVAVSSALRNPGLALLVASSNHAPREVTSTILAYLLCAAIVVTLYIAWRRRSRR